MRDIKFRAHYQGKIYQVTELFWSDGTAYIWDAEFEEGDIVPMHGIDLLQYTGLQDRNGTEIYDGDVVKDVAGHPMWTGGQLSVIQYRLEEQGFRAVVILRDGKLGGRGRFLGDWCEVVGSVYQNSYGIDATSVGFIS